APGGGGGGGGSAGGGRGDHAGARPEAGPAEAPPVAAGLSYALVPAREAPALFAGPPFNRGPRGPGTEAGRVGEGVAVPGEFEQRASGIAGRAGDGSGAEQVAGLEVAAVDGVVGDHLGEGPVHVAEVALGDSDGGDVLLAHLGRGEVDFEGDVEA